MKLWLILLIILLSVIAVVLAISYLCFRITFYVNNRQKQHEEFEIPPGKAYLPYKEQMILLMKETAKIPYEQVEIKSFDGLTLRGKYYEIKKGAPVEIMFHGYRGTSERDLCGGVQRCFKLGRNTILVDQRGQGKSEGRVITFGAKEKYDAVSWANYAAERFGKDVKLLLTGISMGASTVLMASELELPETVKTILGDCGYTSAEEIIKKVLKGMHLPPLIFMPFIRLGARLFGGFSLKDANAKEALKNSRLPVLFIHGKEDKFVPFYMSEENYKACGKEKKLMAIDGAEHGLSYLVAPEQYFNSLKEFEKSIGI